MASPTPYPELDRLLAELVAGAQDALDASFCGAYLQGSFALGDADEHSDVDFVVVIHDELSNGEQTALQQLHARLYEREVAWAQHLEGSYVPKGRLRRVDPSRAPFFYLDNGARELVWDDHCNTAVVRWTLRERGVVLAGPDPEELLDPVPPGELRAEARTKLHEYTAWARESHDRYVAGDRLAFSRWQQPYLVLSFCRMLYTLDAAEVTSKRRAGEWALE
ncbi:MAG TPA: aminoglycoside adenylyltransferase domain-containing protein, partial [Gaiellaceae bacterium]|nr:aminoglycoside adenylyltransferase domain-containing protein [Gaiellaceae bacterium]